MTFFTFTGGQERKFPFLMALRQVDLVGNPAAGVKVADGRLQAGEFVDVVDCLTRRGAVLHGVNVMAHSADRRDSVERIEGVVAIG